MNNIISIILVALLGFIGNIVYFNHQLKKERNKEVLKMRLTNLLLPLFVALKNDEIELKYSIKFDDPYDFDSDKPTRLLNKLSTIINANLYLADDDLHEACISFMQWAYLSDTDQRYQDLHNNIDVEDVDFENFKNVVYKKYYTEREKYLC